MIWHSCKKCWQDVADARPRVHEYHGERLLMTVVNISYTHYVQGKAVIDSESALGGGRFAVWQQEPAEWIAVQGWEIPRLIYEEQSATFDAHFGTEEQAVAFTKRYHHILHYSVLHLESLIKILKQNPGASINCSEDGWSILRADAGSDGAGETNEWWDSNQIAHSDLFQLDGFTKIEFLAAALAEAGGYRIRMV